MEQDLDERLDSMDQRTKLIRQLVEQLKIVFEEEHPNLAFAMFAYGLAKKFLLVIGGFVLGYLWAHYTL